MANVAIAPFFGLSGENGTEFIQRCDLMLRQQYRQGYTEDWKVSTVAQLLRGRAWSWYVKEVPDDWTYDRFRREFLKRFQADPSEEWRQFQILSQIRQKAGQGAEEFVMEIYQKGTGLGASETKIRDACLAGMSDGMRRELLHHDIQTIDDILTWIRRLPPPRTTEEMSNSLAAGIAERLNVRAVEGDEEQTDSTSRIRRLSSPQLTTLLLQRKEG